MRDPNLRMLSNVCCRLEVCLRSDLDIDRELVRNTLNHLMQVSVSYKVNKMVEVISKPHAVNSSPVGAITERPVFVGAGRPVVAPYRMNTRVLKLPQTTKQRKQGRNKMKAKHNNNTAATSVADQAAINEMAKQVYLADQVKDAKAKALAKFAGSIAGNEQTFLDGIPFEFTLDTPDGTRKVSGRLELRHRRDWADVDIVIEKA